MFSQSLAATNPRVIIFGLASAASRRRWLFASAVVMALLAVRAETALGDPSDTLHQRINLLMEATQIGPAAVVVTDEGYVRRVYLDLIGRIPSAEETREFMADASAGKRGLLVAKLLSSKEASEHLATVFDMWLMERRKDQHVTTADWRKYLSDSLAANKPYNELAREILAAEGLAANPQPTAKFYLDRDVETHSVTRDVSRVFFGRDIQCAQCHDHPLISDYLQSEYYGLFSFLNRSYLFTDEKDKKQVAVAEKAEGDVAYSSVFEPDAEKVTAVPALPDGVTLEVEPQFVAGEGYQIKPAKNVQPIPDYSRRRRLAGLVASGESQMFTRNIVNRLWRHMLGRGFVEPPDLHHSDNPPVHPELLQLIADDFAASGFDVKRLLHEIALTNAYQRSIELPLETSQVEWRERLDDLNGQLQFQEKLLARIDEDLQLASKQLTDSRLKMREHRLQLRKALDEVGAGRKSQGEAAANLKKAADELASKQKLLASVVKAAEAARQVAAELKEDQELLKAAETIAARKESIESELPLLESKAGGLRETHEASVQAVTEAEQHVSAFESKRSELLNQSRGLQGAYGALARQVDSVRARRLDLQQRIALVKQFESYELRLTQREEAARMLQALQQRKREVAADMQQRVAVVEQMEAEVAARQAELAKANAMLSAAQESRRNHETLTVSIHEAVEKTAAVLAALPADPDVLKAHETLSTRADQCSTRSAEFESAVNQCEQGVEAAKRQLAESDARLADQQSKRESASTMLASTLAEIDAATEALQAADVRLQQNQKRLHEMWGERFFVAQLKPLTPEQMAASLIQALGLEPQLRRGAESEWQGKNKDKKPEEIGTVDRAQQIDELYRKRRDDVVATFVSLFASAPGSPQDVFQATVDQALFFANDGRMRGWLQPADGSLTKRLQDLKDNHAVASELYLSVLNREPAEEEIEQVVQYLQQRPDDRKSVLQELIWSVVTSLEFRFNH